MSNHAADAARAFFSFPFVFTSSSSSSSSSSPSSPSSTASAPVKPVFQRKPLPSPKAHPDLALFFLHSRPQKKYTSTRVREASNLVASLQFNRRDSNSREAASLKKSFTRKDSPILWRSSSSGETLGQTLRLNMPIDGHLPINRRC